MRDPLVSYGASSFAYDAGGRRREYAFAGGTTAYLYDGANPIQEKVDGTATVNVLGGLGMDEVYQRTDSGGARSLMVDGMNSTLGLMDSTGASSTEYTYEPFGGTTSTGVVSANAFQYTGREAGAGGLMYYRARYYSPGLQRFISQDPLGFGGEDVNLYGYVGNGPTNGVDPTGLESVGHHWFPVELIDRYVDARVLGADAADYFRRWSSLQTYPDHRGCHPGYTAAVMEQFEVFLAGRALMQVRSLWPRPRRLDEGS